jgi:ubiquinone/menaquinone biosynthesis C-methylase UbiE
MHGNLKRIRKPKVVTDIKLDLGCGKHKTEGFIGVDAIKYDGVDRVFDLTKTPWPWKDSSIAEVASNYFLGFLDGPQRMTFMNECGRILKPGGKLSIKVPHWSCMRSISDPLYQWPPISETSFLVFNKEWRAKNDQDHYPVTCDFDYGYGYTLSGESGPRNDEWKQFAIQHYNNTVLDLLVTMTKRPTEN